MAARSAVINVMIRAAGKAARSLKRDYQDVDFLQSSRKGPGDFVSTADTKAERILREELSRGRPGYSFLMEESGAIAGSDPSGRWLVDPLDGTLNFLHGIPHFAVSIGLERDGELVAGVVFDPIKDELYWAEKGFGAYLNSRRLRASGRQQLSEALVGTGIPGPRAAEDADRARFVAEVDATLAVCAGLRRSGSAALDLAYVAAGRYDAFWEDNLSPWDIAAGIVLVREAGGIVSEIDGGSAMLESGSVFACNNHLHRGLAERLRQARKKAPAKP